MKEDELETYKKDMKFFQELRRSVKFRYSETIDHKEYEAKMQKLMDNYIAAEDVIRITNPVDISDEKAFEAELKRLNTKRARADAIRTRLTKQFRQNGMKIQPIIKNFPNELKKRSEPIKKNGFRKRNI